MCELRTFDTPKNAPKSNAKNRSIGKNELKRYSQETLEKRGKIPMGVTKLRESSVEKKQIITNTIVISSFVTFIDNGYFCNC